jgi:hypothetical protein
LQFPHSQSHLSWRYLLLQSAVPSRPPPPIVFKRDEERFCLYSFLPREKAAEQTLKNIQI